MRAYVINLESRPDRWRHVLEQWQCLPWELVRVNAMDSAHVSAKYRRYLTPEVGACWESHTHALRAIAEGADSHGIVLEDDFLVRRPSSLRDLDSVMVRNRITFLQIGYLSPGIAMRASKARVNLRDHLTKIYTNAGPGMPGSQLALERSRLLREWTSLERGVVLDDIRPGAHAYVVERGFARTLIEVEQSFLSTDLYYMSLGEMRSFRMARLTQSAIDQTGHTTSITNRFSRH